MLLSLGLVTGRSADFERTERIHCGLLGMHVGPRPAIAVPGRRFYFGDAAVLHVLPRVTSGAGEARTDTATGAGIKIDHIALEAEDRPAFENRPRAAGQPFESWRLADSSTWQIILVDPDGARVELSFSPAAAS